MLLLLLLLLLLSSTHWQARPAMPAFARRVQAALVRITPPP
jgi:hypothetical protein